jgi:cyclopropane fatty-acyl-phospholipid synthase-like methyltransferase
MTQDPSAGYDEHADAFMAARSTSGKQLVQAWAASLPAGAHIVDVGCGHGHPMTSVLVDQGLHVSAIDASPRLVAAFRQRFPDIEIACEVAQDSRFFDRTFDASLMVGLIFLLPEKRQQALISRLSGALRPGGQLLFSAPWQAGTWKDMITHQTSRSLGRAAYAGLLADAGFELVATHTDDAETHYYEARRS